MFSAISAIATLTCYGIATILVSPARFWLASFMTVSFSWCSWRNARHLPSGGRHLNFYDPGQPRCQCVNSVRCR